MTAHLSYVEAVVVGAFQGVTELFPVSSLGHAVLVPALVGGRWAQDLSVSAHRSPYLAFIVGLHVATAAALLVFFWRDWVRILAGFFSSLRHRRIRTPRRAAGLADRGGHHPGGVGRAGAGAAVPHHPRQARPGGGLPAAQRRRAVCR